MKPLAVDLFCGLFGWSEGLIAEGWQVVGVDIEDMRARFGFELLPHAGLIIQDVRAVSGAAFSEARLIVGSSPCQEFSYRAMPWKRAKALGPPLLGIELFNEQFRIRREAGEAAGRHIPMVVENVRGAQPWVGRARWNYGSYYLWGDVPALMPPILRAPAKRPGHDWNRYKETGEVSPHWRMNGEDSRKLPGFRFDGSGRSFQSASVEGVKQPSIGGPRDNGKGDAWFQDGAARRGSKSSARKLASAMIARIPLPLARHIGRTFR